MFYIVASITKHFIELLSLPISLNIILSLSHTITNQLSPLPLSRPVPELAVSHPPPSPSRSDLPGYGGKIQSSSLVESTALATTDAEIKELNWSQAFTSNSSNNQ